MTDKFTPGPWITSPKHPADIYGARGGNPVARCVYPLADGECTANAKRIVSCVNALEGLNQYALDGGWNFEDHGRAARAMEIERNELLQALTNLRDAIEAGKEPALSDANRAIRKANGGSA